MWPQLLSHQTCPFRSPRLYVQGKFSFSTFLTRNEGITDESEKRFRCYQQEHFSFPRNNSVSDRSQGIVNNREFKMPRRRRQRERQKAIACQGQTTTLHVHHVFCTSLCLHCTSTTWKCFFSRFLEYVNEQSWQDFLSLSELGYGWKEFCSRRVRLHLTK